MWTGIESTTWLEGSKSGIIDHLPHTSSGCASAKSSSPKSWSILFNRKPLKLWRSFNAFESDENTPQAHLHMTNDHFVFPTVNLKTSPMNLIYTTKLCQIYYSHYLLTAKNSHITMITSFSHNLKIDRGHHCHFPSRIRFALRFVLMFGSLEFWHQMRGATSITRAIAKIIVLSGWKHFIRLDSKWFKNRVRWLFSIIQWNM